MIKSKIEAREKALALAVEVCKYDINESRVSNVLTIAKQYEEYMIGSVDLPEVEPSIEDMTNRAMDRIIEATRMPSPYPPTYGIALNKTKTSE